MKSKEKVNKIKEKKWEKNGFKPSPSQVISAPDLNVGFYTYSMKFADYILKTIFWPKYYDYQLSKARRSLVTKF